MGAFKSIHKYYTSCYNEKNEFDDEKAKALIKSYMYYGDERLGILKSLYTSIMNSKFLNKFGRLYVMNSNMTFKDISDNYNEHLKEGEEKVNENTCIAQIAYCSKRVNEVFKDINFGKKTFDIITWLLDSNTFRLDNDIEKQALKVTFLNQLNMFVDLYIDRPVLNRKDMLIRLPICERVKEIDQDRFNEFMELIKPYSRKALRETQAALDNYLDCVGYLKYIVANTSDLEQVDRNNKTIVLDWIGRENDVIDNINELDDAIYNNYNNDEDIN